MRLSLSHVERFRIQKGPFATEPEADSGTLLLPTQWGTTLECHYDRGLGAAWERVAVLCRKKKGDIRTPTWEEMQLAKEVFWQPKESVVQLHVPDYAKLHLNPHVLWLWRAKGQYMPRPSGQEVAGRRIVLPG